MSWDPSRSDPDVVVARNTNEAGAGQLEAIVPVAPHHASARHPSPALLADEAEAGLF